MGATKIAISDEQKWEKMTPLIEQARSIAGQFGLPVMITVEQLSQADMRDFAIKNGDAHVIEFEHEDDRSPSKYWGLTVKSKGGQVLKNFVHYVHVETAGGSD